MSDFDPGAFRETSHPPVPEVQPLVIEPEDGETSFRPGESVRGTVRWELEEPPTEVVLRLFWFTEGKGTQDVEVVAEEVFEAPGPRDRRDFRFELPAGPYSFSGRLISLIWALELVADPGDRTARRTLTIGPEGHEVRLESVTPELEAEG